MATEYLGVLVVGCAIGVVLVAASGGLGQQIAEGIHGSICRILGGGCEAGVTPQALPKCVTSTHDRTVGLSATAWSVKIGHGDTYTQTQYGDGKARVVTADSYAVGAEASGGGKVDLASFLKKSGLGGNKGMYGDLPASAGIGAPFPRWRGRGGEREGGGERRDEPS